MILYTKISITKPYGNVRYVIEINVLNISYHLVIINISGGGGERGWGWGGGRGQGGGGGKGWGGGGRGGDLNFELLDYYL